MKYRMIDSNDPTPIRIEQIKIVWEFDSDGTPAYLESRDYGPCPETEAALYAAQDAKRLADFGTAWFMEGCRAVAIASIVAGSGARSLHQFESPGLWGIESDSSADYKREVERKELAGLADILTTFHVPVTLPLEVTA